MKGVASGEDSNLSLLYPRLSQQVWVIASISSLQNQGNLTHISAHSFRMNSITTSGDGNISVLKRVQITSCQAWPRLTLSAVGPACVPVGTVNRSFFIAGVVSASGFSGSSHRRFFGLPVADTLGSGVGESLKPTRCLLLFVCACSLDAWNVSEMARRAQNHLPSRSGRLHSCSTD